jgi:hypothetical protein
MKGVLMATAFVPITDKTLGQILVERKVISPTHLQMALDRQKRGNGEYKYIGEILLEMGVSQEKINEALNASGKRKRLGEILMDLEMLTSDELRQALEKQKQLSGMAIRRPLGKLLLEMGYTNYEVLQTGLSKHFNMPTISLKGVFPSPSLQKALGDAYALRHKIVVLEDDFTKIRLAIAEPNLLVMDELRRVFRAEKRMEFYLANPMEMDYCLRHKFDPFLVSHYR